MNGKRWIWMLILVPTLAGCAMDDDYVAPPPVPAYYPPPPNSCAAPQPVSYQSQSQEPPR